MKPPLVVGAGPAGCAAAIRLARGGAAPVLVDRDETVGDALCGGFLSWQTVAALREIGFDPQAAGAHRVERLRMFAGSRRAEASLPATGFGLSRRALDGGLRELAIGAGARLEIDRIRHIENGCAVGEVTRHASDSIFLATGKHDVRGLSRTRREKDPALGMRVRCHAPRALHDLLTDHIELHFFEGGYAGIVLQEEDSANICLAVRKSLLSHAAGEPRALLEQLARQHPAFAERLAYVSTKARIESIGSVPYGWRALDTFHGLFRLGDQAAVIPSLAGEGIGIALASAETAVRAWREGGPAASHAYQRRFAAGARRPLLAANSLWHVAEVPTGAAILTGTTRMAPRLAHLAMRLSRI